MLLEIKEKWVAALRSGKYKQGTGHLRYGRRHCCLGVLCDVVAPNDWIGDAHKYEAAEDSVIADSYLSDLGLPRMLASELVKLNDGEASFSAIAAVIENEVPINV